MQRLVFAYGELCMTMAELSRTAWQCRGACHAARDADGGSYPGSAGDTGNTSGLPFVDGWLPAQANAGRKRCPHKRASGRHCRGRPVPARPRH